MKERIEWLDIAKGIGIVSVFYGHCTQSLCNDLFLYIYTFHMPLFFVLSGLCFNCVKYSQKEYLGEFFYKRFNQLIVPLISSMIIFCGLKSAFGLGTYTFDKLCSLNFPPAMWFVFSLLVIEVLYCLISQVIHPNRILHAILVVIGLALTFLISKFKCVLPLSLSSVPMGLMFFVVGVELRQYVSSYRVWLQNCRFRGVFSFMLLCLPLMYVFYYKEPLNAADGIAPYSVFFPLLVACIGICAILSFSMVVDLTALTIMKKLLVYLGQNTLTILMFHLFFISVSTVYLRPLLGGIGTEPLSAWIWIAITIPIVNRFAPFLAGKGFHKGLNK